MNSPLVTAAGEYLARGLSIIALTGKTPNVKVHRHGLNEPLTGAPDCDADWDLLRSVFDHEDTTGIGILTTWPYVVVDIDGEDGAKQWAQMLGMPFEGDWVLPDVTWAALTGRGLHLWYASPQPTGTIKLGSKLDLKGTGGYVAAPPSLHPDGHVYKWLRAPGDRYPQEVPEALARVIKTHVEDLEVTRRQATYKKAIYRARDEEYGTRFDPAGILKKMAEAEDGNRNNLLHWAAKVFVEDGASDEDFEALRATAVDVAGLEPVEVRRTIRSARRG